MTELATVVDINIIAKLKTLIYSYLVWTNYIALAFTCRQISAVIHSIVKVAEYGC